VFKAQPIYLVPILASLVFGILCTFLILDSQIEVYGVTPFPEGAGSFGNALYFIILAAVGASVLYLLLKRRKLRLVTLITGFALTTAAFILSFFYLLIILSTLDFPYTVPLVLILAIFITALVDLAVFQGYSRASNMAVLFLGGALGAFLGTSIPALSTVLILGALAVYDVFTVYYGPVGKIARNGLEKLRGLSFSFRDAQMGMGDLTFYSMLISRVLADAGPSFCLFSVIGVMAGAFLAFKGLEKKGIFPGLPLPIALGLLPMIISLSLR
jgi:hypothetical protein